jgi:hypothetical protein
MTKREKTGRETTDDNFYKMRRVAAINLHRVGAAKNQVQVMNRMNKDLHRSQYSKNKLKNQGKDRLNKLQNF